MGLVLSKCTFCKSVVLRSVRRVNESKKNNWKTYCSLKCLGRSRTTRKELVCARDGCNQKIIRSMRDIKKTDNSYCSHRCIAIVLNSKRKLKPKKKCRFCSNILHHGMIYCSPECQRRGTTIPKDLIITLIRNFYIKNKRIPLKREFKNSHAAQKRFGSWNNAILASGYEPNPVMFAKKHTANDGHVCDSLAEKIIDDWFSRRNIKHKINYPYPESKGYTVDFVVGNYWIEFFGLSGELKRYDLLKKKKLRLAKKYNINLIKLYPKDLFPKGNLNKILEPVVLNL